MNGDRALRELQGAAQKLAHPCRRPGGAGGLNQQQRHDRQADPVQLRFQRTVLFDCLAQRGLVEVEQLARRAVGDEADHAHPRLVQPRRDHPRSRHRHVLEPLHIQPTPQHLDVGIVGRGGRGHQQVGIEDVVEEAERLRAGSERMVRLVHHGTEQETGRPSCTTNVSSAGAVSSSTRIRRVSALRAATLAHVVMNTSPGRVPMSPRSRAGSRTRSPGAAARSALAVCGTRPANGANQNHTTGACRLIASAVAASTIVLPLPVGASSSEQPMRRAIARRPSGACAPSSARFPVRRRTAARPPPAGSRAA